MASFKKQLSAKMTAFLYDHKAIPKQGQRLRSSYRDVEKKIQSIGNSIDKKK